MEKEQTKRQNMAKQQQDLLRSPYIPHALLRSGLHHNKKRSSNQWSSSMQDVVASDLSLRPRSSPVLQTSSSELHDDRKIGFLPTPSIIDSNNTRRPLGKLNPLHRPFRSSATVSSIRPESTLDFRQYHVKLDQLEKQDLRHQHEADFEEDQALKWEWWHRWNNSLAHASTWTYHAGLHPLTVQRHVFGSWDQRMMNEKAVQKVFYFNVVTGYGQWDAPPFVVRAKLHEAKSCHEYRSATHIQSFTRTCLAQAKLRVLKWREVQWRLHQIATRHRWALLIIQATLRMCLCAKILEKMKKWWEEEWSRILTVVSHAGALEIHSVVKIQSVQWNLCSKKMVRRLNTFSDVYPWAAPKIQSLARMFTLRLRLRKLRSTWLTDRRRMNALIASATSNLVQLMILFQSQVRMMLAKHRIHNQLSATAAGKKEKKAGKGVVKIQPSFWRRVENIVLLECYRMQRLLDDAQPAHHKAIRSLQSNFRCRCALRKLKLRREEYHLAAERIQSLFWMVVAGLRVQRIRSKIKWDAVVCIQSYLRMWLTQKILAEGRGMERARLDWQELCVRKLQCVYRGVLARRRLRQFEKQRAFMASTVFQAWFRGYKGRGKAEMRRVQVRDEAAVDIQRVFRSHSARERTKRLKNRLTCVAIAMQKAFRRYRSRKANTAIRRITSSIKRHYRRKQAEKVQLVLHTVWAKYWAIAERKRRVQAELQRRQDKIGTLQAATVEAVAAMQQAWTTPEGKHKFNEEKEKIKQQHSMAKQRKKELSKEARQQAHIRSVFDSFDVDGSGTMDKSELQLLLEELCVPLSEEYLSQVLSAIDEDGSGHISFDEFYSWWQSPDFQSAHKDQVSVLKLQGQRFMRSMIGTQLVDETKRVMEFQAQAEVFHNFLEEERHSEYVHSIFVLFPSVRQTYDDTVPAKYSDQEFWRLYYQSMEAFMTTHDKD